MRTASYTYKEPRIYDKASFSFISNEPSKTVIMHLSACFPIFRYETYDSFSCSRCMEWMEYYLPLWLHYTNQNRIQLHTDKTDNSIHAWSFSCCEGYCKDYAHCDSGSKYMHSPILHSAISLLFLQPIQNRSEEPAYLSFWNGSSWMSFSSTRKYVFCFFVWRCNFTHRCNYRLLNITNRGVKSDHLRRTSKYWKCLVNFHMEVFCLSSTLSTIALTHLFDM